MSVPADYVKVLLRRSFGLWPLHESRNRLSRGWRSLPLRAFERAEVRRLAETTPVSRARVAVVIPTYRRPELLTKALASVLAQSFTDFVVIIVDDGAGQLPNLPEDPRVRAVSLSRNCACLGVVRNVGIGLTSSTYIAFLDDDNEWAPDHLEISVAALDEGADFTYTTVERRFADGALFDRLDRAFDRRALREDAFVDSNAIVVRRTPDVRFSRIPRSSLTFPKEDWEFVYRMSRRHIVRHLAVPTVRYLINDESYYTPPWGSR